jgi:hypothetical protein
VKITTEYERCDLCGQFCDLAVTESYNLPGTELACETTVCRTCIDQAAALFASSSTAPEIDVE